MVEVVGSNTKALNYYMRAVRGGQSEPPDRFVNNNDGTITDTYTGLMWQQATADETYTLEQALEYCENLTLPAGGYSDWRLPSKNELHSIVDYNYYAPSIDLDVFPDTFASSRYWSSTTYASSFSDAWIVNFTSGGVGTNFKSYINYVRAVRGGPCGSLGDLDGDGILDDGDNSTVVGDTPLHRWRNSKL